jgi:hemerythrin-like domain-containing protein
MKHAQWSLTELLAEEHRMIQRGLVVLGRMAAHLRDGGEVHPEVVEACLRFLRDFADHEHHEKEERVLFAWLEQNGLSHETGPLAVLRDEHEHVRDHVRRMTAHARHLETDPQSVKAFAAHADELALFFWKHMLKENEVLFPMAEKTGGGTAGLFSWEDGRAQSMLEEYRVLLEHLEKVAAEWPIENVRWPVSPA